MEINIGKDDIPPTVIILAIVVYGIFAMGVDIGEARILQDANKANEWIDSFCEKCYFPEEETLEQHIEYSVENRQVYMVCGGYFEGKLSTEYRVSVPQYEINLEHGR